jgi:hypothetical protein
VDCTFFDKLYFIMRRFCQMTAAGLNYCGALGRKHRLELNMVSPEFSKILNTWQNNRVHSVAPVTRR